MRIHVKLSKNKNPVPFSYQKNLVGALHKWIGDNDVHDGISLYSFAWLKNGKKKGGSLDFSHGASFFISAYDNDLIKRIIIGIQQSPMIAFGMSVTEVILQETPNFHSEQKFFLGSPIFIKQTIESKQKFYYYTDADSDQLMTNTLINKLKKVGISHEGVKVKFDTNYSSAAIKGNTYDGALLKGSICPVIITGTSEQIAFAWNVGIGNNTGMGFGSLI
jgi:CRISPR-associated endoribonuclease Cas6